MPFFEEGPATDPSYANLRDDGREFIREACAFIERLWVETGRYLDPDLPAKAKHGFASAFWEMYLAHVLLRSGKTLVPRAERTPAREGPDILCSPNIWVEAIVPEPGEGQDAVVEPVPGGLHAIPDDQIILRYRTAIAAKLAQIRTHLECGYIEPGDPVIVAISGGSIFAARLELTIPRLVRAVLPIGHEQFTVSTETMDIVGHSFEHRDAITKQSGAEVPVDIFTDGSHAEVSAVLGSCADAVNRPSTPGDGFVFVHNPTAANPLPLEWLECGVEFHIDGDRLTGESRA